LDTRIVFDAPQDYIWMMPIFGRKAVSLVQTLVFGHPSFAIVIVAAKAIPEPEVKARSYWRSDPCVAARPARRLSFAHLIDP
jgi:hypothetical protein